MCNEQNSTAKKKFGSQICQNPAEITGKNNRKIKNSEIYNSKQTAVNFNRNDRIRGNKVWLIKLGNFECLIDVI